MSKIIVWPNDMGGIYITRPAKRMAHKISDWGAFAASQIPELTPYRVLDESDLPENKEQRNGWTLDFLDPDSKIEYDPQIDFEITYRDVKGVKIGLHKIDEKTPRAVREKNDKKLNELEKQAIQLRNKLKELK